MSAVVVLAGWDGGGGDGRRQGVLRLSPTLDGRTGLQSSFWCSMACPSVVRGAGPGSGV